MQVTLGGAGRDWPVARKATEPAAPSADLAACGLYELLAGAFAAQPGRSAELGTRVIRERATFAGEGRAEAESDPQALGDSPAATWPWWLRATQEAGSAAMEDATAQNPRTGDDGLAHQRLRGPVRADEDNAHANPAHDARDVDQADRTHDEFPRAEEAAADGARSGGEGASREVRAGEGAPQGAGSPSGGASMGGGSEGDSYPSSSSGSMEGPAPRPSPVALAPGSQSVADELGGLSALAPGTALRLPSIAEAPAVPNAPWLGSLRAAIRVQTVNGLRMAIVSGEREAWVTLQPPDLGRIRIWLRVDGDQVSARIRAEDPAVEAILRSDHEVLRARLAEHGLLLDALVIEPNELRTPQPTMADDGSRAQLTDDNSRHADDEGERTADSPLRDAEELEGVPSDPAPSRAHGRTRRARGVDLKV